MRYGLRLRRKAWLIRAWAAWRALRAVADRTASIAPDDILLFACVRNEAARLGLFLSHYRALGVAHFLIVDNGSDDGSARMLCAQPDVSLWHSTASYRAARYGADWMMALLARHGTGHWVVIVDPDELLVYAHCDTRPLPALTAWLDAAGQPGFPTLLLDLYPGPDGSEDLARVEGAGACPPVTPGAECAVQTSMADPNGAAVAGWFDPVGYSFRVNRRHGNLWAQGGPRARAFFAQAPRRAPALNKIPLMRWQRGQALVSSTHSLLPARLNRLYATDGGLAPQGCLLHTKFLLSAQELTARARAEAARAQHYGGGREYAAYRDGLGQGVRLWTPASCRYAGWRQLEALGLLSSGDWA